MKLSKPKNITWWIAVILGAAGLIGYLAKLPFFGTYAFWLVLAGLVLLALGNLLKGF